MVRAADSEEPRQTAQDGQHETREQLAKRQCRVCGCECEPAQPNQTHTSRGDRALLFCSASDPFHSRLSPPLALPPTDATSRDETRRRPAPPSASPRHATRRRRGEETRGSSSARQK
ncbi:hypothetical protein DAI22_03g010050 [Oryza sativa Japonica Group]|nr:hypothetical protein DAI22_03g010050 [Oryza sativa Japonica Group]